MNFIHKLFGGRPNVEMLAKNKDESGLFWALTYEKDQGVREAALIALIDIAASEKRPPLVSDSLARSRPFLTKEIFSSLYMQAFHGRWRKSKFSSTFEECSQSLGFDIVSILLDQLRNSDRAVLGICYEAIARLDHIGVTSTIKPIVALAAQCKPSDLNGRCILACTNIFLRNPDETAKFLRGQVFSAEERDRISVAIRMATTHSNWKNIRSRWESEGRIRKDQTVDFDTVVSLLERSVSAVPSEERKEEDKLSFTGKTLILEFSARGDTSIDLEAKDLKGTFLAMKAMGHSKNELLSLIINCVFEKLMIKSIFLTDSAQSAVEAENSKVIMVVQLNSASPSDKDAIEHVLRQKTYQPQKDDLFFNVLLHLSVWCGWRSPTCSRSERVLIFPNSSSADFSRF